MKHRAAKLADRALRAADTTVTAAAVIALLLLILIGGYAIWDAEQVYRAASGKQYELYKPTDENSGKSFAELQAINPEVFAWLTVYGTHIDYPVAQGPDNIKYVNTNAEGNYSLTGAIFLDVGSRRDFSDFSSILYGHHMEKNAMFGEIGSFVDRRFFEERRYGNLYFAGKEHGLEFFAFLHADAYDREVFRTGIRDAGSAEAYLALIRSRALHTKDVPVTAQDRIVLLSTCTADFTNGRDILVGRITDEVYADTFKKKETGILRAVDTVKALWERLPLRAKLVAAMLLLLLLTLAFYYIMRRIRKRDVNENEGR
ncbi:MAG: class B sortase [Clostridiales Family XIII bacterium]|jgi:sortase B|nr:class B sortase [Clostridiales Family XIII bacterium]